MSAAPYDPSRRAAGGEVRERRPDFRAIPGGKARPPAPPRPTADAEQEKLLPQNLEAEAAVLGSILIDAAALAEIAAFLKPEDFHKHEHRGIYAAMLDLHADGTPVDTILLNDELDRRGTLEDCGGLSYLSGLPLIVPTSRNARHYAEIVQRTAILRRLIHAAGKIAGIAQEQPDSDIALVQAQALVYDLAQIGTADSYFPIMDDTEAEELEPAQGIIGDILYENSLAILYGRSGRWKSFVALSMALAIATGRPWLGRPVREGTVLYIAAEGGRGIGKRITAWKRQHGVSGRTRLKTLLVPVQLLEEGQVEKLVASVRAKIADDEPPALVVLDTLSRSMAGGDANASKDGSRAIEQADKIRRAFDCCVLIVAHPGKDETRGISGWAGYFNAADTVMKIDSSHNNPRLEIGETIKLTSEKPKDSEPFADIALTTVAQSWARSDGSPVNSLVIVPGDLEQFQAAKSDPDAAQPSTAAQRKTLDLLRTALGGLNANDWQRQSPLSRPQFFRVRKQWQDAGVIELGDDGKYTCSPAGITP